MTGIKAILSIGGNIGKIEENFLAAKRKLEASGLTQLKTSNLYRNKAVGCSNGTPDFINAAFSGFWNKTVDELHELCKDIEVSCGRSEKHPKYSSRTLDIDIIFYGTLVLKSKKLQIPHKETLKRLFVILPISELEPNFMIPSINHSVSDYMIASFNPNKIHEFKKMASPFPKV